MIAIGRWLALTPRGWRAASAIAIMACGGTGCAGSDPVRLRAIFGTTEYLPLAPPGTRASDYVADGETVVAETVRRCGGVGPRFYAGTDGAAAVVFTVAGTADPVKACIAKALPQVTIEAARFP